MENEHTNNCGEFRAVKEMPLPYNIDNNSDDDDDNSHYDTVNESNIQNFVKRFNRSGSTNNNNNSNYKNVDNNNSMNENNDSTIDITKFKEIVDKNDKNIRNFKNNSKCDSLNIKRSHSQALIHLNRSYGMPSDNDTYSVSNINKNSNNDGKFDLHDPVNYNRTIHTYNVDSEFNQYLSKMKENLTSIDTFIKRYDNKQETNQLSIRIEKFIDKHQKFDIFDFHDKNINNPYNKQILQSENNKHRNSETIRIDSEEEKDEFPNIKPLTSLFNNPKPPFVNDENNSSSSLTNSESITLYSVK